jgi:serine protease Do
MFTSKARPVAVLILTLAALALPATARAHSGPPGFADLAEKLLPAVVNISTSQTVTGNEDTEDQMPPDLQLPPGSPFEQFFKDFMEKQKGQQRKHKTTALGSGFIIDPSGYIVTNYHVIEDADQITVILQDDTNLTATVVGKDKKTDLALIKVETKKPLPAVIWGDSDKVRVGDWIIAIGDPYGLGGTVTAGIISARARDINAGPYDEFLQTDAPINRGNSGGPMFNMDGEVVGVNTAIFSPSGGSIGIGFAIPSSLAKNVITQLREHGHIQRGWLGVLWWHPPRPTAPPPRPAFSRAT